MSENISDKYHQLSVGFEFPPQSYTLDSSTVEAYLQATRESNPIFKKERLVPPMEVAAMVMSALGSVMIIPSGTIHVSQELDFLKGVRVGETITCYSKVSSKQDRGGLHSLSCDIWVLNEDLERVLAGKVGFILPEQATINDHGEVEVNPD
jgi:acyl dehydratase